MLQKYQKYHSIYKNETFETRFVRNKHPLQKRQPLWESALVDSIVLIDGLSWACGGICHTLDKD